MFQELRNLESEEEQFDEGVEVDVAKFTEFVFNRQTADADEDLFVDEMVLRVHFVH